MANRVWRFLVNTDRAWNNLVLNGGLDQTISAHSALAARQGRTWGCVLCKLLNMIQKDHCEKQLADPDTSGG